MTIPLIKETEVSQNRKMENPMKHRRIMKTTEVPPAVTAAQASPRQLPVIGADKDNYKRREPSTDQEKLPCIEPSQTQKETHSVKVKQATRAKA